MLDEGTYAPQTVIDASTEIEAKQTANSMWELWRGQNKDSNIRLDIDDSDFTHTSETIGCIAEKLLHDREWLEKQPTLLCVMPMNGKLTAQYRDLTVICTTRLPYLQSYLTC